MKKSEDFALSTTGVFNPTKFLYISATNNFLNHVAVYDLTSLPNHKYTSLSDTYVAEAKSLAESISSYSAIFTLDRAHWYSTRTSITKEGSNVAGINAPLTAFGMRKFTFPSESPHSSHAIEMKPVGIGRRAEGFVKDSVQYF